MKRACHESDHRCNVAVLVAGLAVIPGSPFMWAAGLSIALNAALGWAYLGQRDKTVKAESAVTAMEQQRDGARAAASACSDAVEDLRTVADQRAAEAKAARAEAAAKARGHNKKADDILATPAAAPGDDCRSAQVRVADWIKGRAKP